VRCADFIGANQTHDDALLRRRGTPGDTFGSLALDDRALSPNRAIALLHQSCAFSANQAAVTMSGFNPLGRFSLAPGRPACVRVDDDTGVRGEQLVVDVLRVRPPPSPPPPAICTEVRFVVRPVHELRRRHQRRRNRSLKNDGRYTPSTRIE
jgi:hypothetical protein